MITLLAIMGTVGTVAAVLFAIYRQGKRSERLAQNEDTIKKVAEAKKVAAAVNRDSDSNVLIELLSHWKRK